MRSATGAPPRLRYARAGAAVAAIDINLSGAEDTAKIITAEGGVALPLVADVTNEDDVAAAVALAAGELGVPDGLAQQRRSGGHRGAP